MRTFTLTDEQESKYEAWRKEKGNLPSATIGGAFTFCFTPTGIGHIIEAVCFDGTKIDLTENF
jgi:hypothetical protein